MQLTNALTSTDVAVIQKVLEECRAMAEDSAVFTAWETLYQHCDIMTAAAGAWPPLAAAAARPEPVVAVPANEPAAKALAGGSAMSPDYRSRGQYSRSPVGGIRSVSAELELELELEPEPEP